MSLIKQADSKWESGVGHCFKIKGGRIAVFCGHVCTLIKSMKRTKEVLLYHKHSFSRAGQHFQEKLSVEERAR